MAQNRRERSTDICKCGDYRGQHPNNGPCVFKTHGIPDKDLDTCKKFRLNIRKVRPGIIQAGTVDGERKAHA